MTSDLIFKLIDDIEVVESDLKDINYNELLGIIMINRISGIVYKKIKFYLCFIESF